VVWSVSGKRIESRLSMIKTTEQAKS